MGSRNLLSPLCSSPQPFGEEMASHGPTKEGLAPFRRNSHADQLGLRDRPAGAGRRGGSSEPWHGSSAPSLPWRHSPVNITAGSDLPMWPGACYVPIPNPVCFAERGSAGSVAVEAGNGNCWRPARSHQYQYDKEGLCRQHQQRSEQQWEQQYNYWPYHHHHQQQYCHYRQHQHQHPQLQQPIKHGWAPKPHAGERAPAHASSPGPLTHSSPEGRGTGDAGAGGAAQGWRLASSSLGSPVVAGRPVILTARELQAAHVQVTDANPQEACAPGPGYGAASKESSITAAPSHHAGADLMPGFPLVITPRDPAGSQKKPNRPLKCPRPATDVKERPAPPTADRKVRGRDDINRSALIPEWLSTTYLPAAIARPTNANPSLASKAPELSAELVAESDDESEDDSEGVPASAESTSDPGSDADVEETPTTRAAARKGVVTRRQGLRTASDPADKSGHSHTHATRSRTRRRAAPPTSSESGSESPEPSCRIRGNRRGRTRRQPSKPVATSAKNRHASSRAATRRQRGRPVRGGPHTRPVVPTEDEGESTAEVRRTSTKRRAPVLREPDDESTVTEGDSSGAEESSTATATVVAASQPARLWSRLAPYWVDVNYRMAKAKANRARGKRAGTRGARLKAAGSNRARARLASVGRASGETGLRHSTQEMTMVTRRKRMIADLQHKAAGGALETEESSGAGVCRRTKRHRTQKAAGSLPQLLGATEGQLLAVAVFGPRALNFLPDEDKGAVVSH
ncbi:unnamed protein product [Chrysoparadoxa australica]